MLNFERLVAKECKTEQVFNKLGFLRCNMSKKYLRLFQILILLVRSIIGDDMLRAIAQHGRQANLRVDLCHALRVGLRRTLGSENNILYFFVFSCKSGGWLYHESIRDVLFLPFPPARGVWSPEQRTR